MEKDFKNNAVSGKNVMMIDTTKCVVHASSGKLVVVQGLEDFIIADTKDVLLICRKEKEQDIKNYVSEIRKNTGNRYMFTTKLDVYSQVG
jgi:mannose-1-phosphate guanylyltransferase